MAGRAEISDAPAVFVEGTPEQIDCSGVREADPVSTEAEAELAATSLGDVLPDTAERDPTVARLAALAVEEVERAAAAPNPWWELKEMELPSHRKVTLSVTLSVTPVWWCNALHPRYTQCNDGCNAGV